AVQRLAAEGLLIKGGGHKMAAGLTVARNKLDMAMARLGELLAKQGAGAGGPADLRLDGLLSPGAANLTLVEQLDEAGPFGAASPAPRFAFADQTVVARRIGENHLRLTLSDGLGAKLEAVAFGAFDGPLGPALENAGHQRFHLAGKLEVNTYGGRSKVQLRLDDAARA
ncbi:MAG: single-stranded-DNA-specific exonuclease RecJ, partial [Paracoccaceae bacterium]